MTRTAPPPHYVRHNKVTRVPRNIICFDSEARREAVSNGEVQSFRVAVAMRDRRSHDGDRWREREMGVFDSPDDLWSWVDVRTEARARTVCVAHNLAYDLRITAALTVLPALGWELVAIRLDRNQAWCRWRKGDRTLVMCDSMAWTPVALEKLGAMVGLAKLPLPDWEDSDEAWRARCERDVDILSTVVRRLVDWVRVDDLGNWRPTGAGQSWSAFRHRFLSHRILAHDDQPARDAERVAAWTGRCEVWRWGRPLGGPFSEWDYSAAYAHIGAESDVPIKLVGQSAHASLRQWSRLRTKYAVLAECTVTTDVPTLPCQVDGRIAWPVGTFDTCVWDNELALAIEKGATVVVHRVWWYRRAPALREFCRWALDVLRDDGNEHDPVVVCAVKHWSRALVGRFGARWSEWETVGRAPVDGLGLSRVIDGTSGERWNLLHVGTTLKRQGPEFDSPDAVVSIMSWVMAECRVRLWRLIECAGAEHVCYMDTDGLIVDRHGAARIAAARFEGVRCKGEWGTVEMLAPRQIVVGGTLRASGVPRGSVKVGPELWAGEVFEELSTALRAGRSDVVRTAVRTVRVSGKDARRTHLEGGATAPIVVGGASS